MSTAATYSPNAVGLIDGAVREGDKENRDKNMSGGCSSSRIWIILAVVFFVTSVAMAIYIAYFKITEEDKATTEKKRILEKYPGYFRTQEQQYMVEAEYEMANNLTINDSAPQDNTTQYPNGNCFFSCNRQGRPTPGLPARKRRSASFPSTFMESLKMYMTVHKLNKRASTKPSAPIFHGCCISRHFFKSLDTATDIEGNPVMLVQFKNERQYFPTQECKHAASCSGCTCAQETAFMSAVVKDNKDTLIDKDGPTDQDDDVSVKLIKIKGCCKCFNNL